MRASTPPLESLPGSLANDVRAVRAGLSEPEDLASLDALVSALVGARGRAEAAQHALSAARMRSVDSLAMRLERLEALAREDGRIP